MVEIAVVAVIDNCENLDNLVQLIFKEKQHYIKGDFSRKDNSTMVSYVVEIEEDELVLMSSKVMQAFSDCCEKFSVMVYHTQKTAPSEKKEEQVVRQPSVVMEEPTTSESGNEESVTTLPKEEVNPKKEEADSGNGFDCVEPKSEVEEVKEMLEKSVSLEEFAESLRLYLDIPESAKMHFLNVVKVLPTLETVGWNEIASAIEESGGSFKQYDKIKIVRPANHRLQTITFRKFMRVLAEMLKNHKWNESVQESKAEPESEDTAEFVEFKPMFSTMPVPKDQQVICRLNELQNKIDCSKEIIDFSLRTRKFLHVIGENKLAEESDFIDFSQNLLNMDGEITLDYDSLSIDQKEYVLKWTMVAKRLYDMYTAPNITEPKIYPVKAEAFLNDLKRVLFSEK